MDPLHELSSRGREHFQAVDCAALPDSLFESRIFGYEKGAFTGANDRKPWRVVLVDGGTLFLDEIGDLSLVAQAKVLRVLEDGGSNGWAARSSRAAVASRRRAHAHSAGARGRRVEQEGGGARA